MRDNGIKAIRAETLIALPTDDSYLFRLGVAIYGFASVNSFMCEIISYLDTSKNRTELQNKESGKILDFFRHTTKVWKGVDISGPAKRAADSFEQLNTQRSDFVHSYPITNSSSEQILHRRVDEKNKYFEVTNEFLDNFISRLTIVDDALYEIRGRVKPKI